MLAQAGFQRLVYRQQAMLQARKAGHRKLAAQQGRHDAGALGLAVQNLGAFTQALCQADPHVPFHGLAAAPSQQPMIATGC